MRTELALLILAAACRPDTEPLRVFVAASMEEPITAIAGADAEVNAAASSVLARQIDSGAEADLYLSADRAWADWLTSRSAVLATKVIARNRLVLIAAADDRRTIDELLGARLAIADPAHVPAGKYARAALQALGRYREGSIAAAADVRAALALVERGEADAGVVYRTDALLSRKVRVVSELACPLPIEYVAVLLDEQARPFYDRLTSDEVLGRYGFEPP